jgi:hypothetical protein
MWGNILIEKINVREILTWKTIESINIKVSLFVLHYNLKLIKAKLV